MERLCFGIFINILAQCRNKKVARRRLVNEIVKTIDPNSKYNVNKEKNVKSADRDNSVYRALNHLYKCTGDFTPQYSSVVELAPKADRGEVIRQFRENVIPLIDQDKAALAVLALKDIIKKDSTLIADSGDNNVERFQRYIGGKTIQSFLNETQYDLSEVLASIFLYTVIAVKNTEGIEWLTEISAKYKDISGGYNTFFKKYVNDFCSVASNTEDIGSTEIRAHQMHEQSPAKVSRSVWDPFSADFLDNFYKAFNDYTIPYFIKSNPIDLKLINCNATTEKPDWTTLVVNAIHFVMLIKKAMSYIKINEKNIRFCGEVSTFLKMLEDYIDFIWDNSPIPTEDIELTTLMPYGVKGVRYTENNLLSVDGEQIYELDQEASRKAFAEYERRMTEYRTNLQAQAKKINDCVYNWEHLTMYAHYDGPKYKLKEP